MAIPPNLIPTNISVQPQVNLSALRSVGGIPANLIPINASDIDNKLDSIAGQIPEVTAPDIPNLPAIEAILPDNLFLTGSIDEVRERALRIANRFTDGLPKLPILSLASLPIPGLRPISVVFPPKVPSFAEIKNFIEIKVDRIKKQRQQSSINALKDKLKKQQNPFEYRQSLINESQSLLGTVGTAARNAIQNNIRG